MKNLTRTDFQEGNLEGISLLLPRGSSSIFYPNGNTDLQMIEDMRKNLKIGDVIFDVGAYIGTSSLIFSKLLGKKGRVIAFEPNKFNRERMTKNFGLNKSLAQKVQIEPFALADQKGKVNMIMSENIDDGYSSTSRLEGAHPKISRENLPEGFFDEEIDVISLDEFVKNKGLIPSFIKVDIEGGEYKFLLGAKETITQHAPTLYIELHSEYCAVSVVKLLYSHGYVVSILYEEPDNRVMIKAIKKDKVKKKTEEEQSLLLERVSDLLFSNSREITVMFKTITDQATRIESLESHIKKMVEENITIREITKERIINLESEKETLSNDVKSYENSISWWITKPFRIISKVIRKIFKNV